MKKIKKRLVAFLCLFCAVITIFPAKNTVYASESVSAEEKEKVEKYVMDTLDVYLCYAGSYGWSQKMFDYGTKRQNDIAIMNLTKRLAMFRLSENIQATGDKPESPTQESPTTEVPKFVPPTK